VTSEFRSLLRERARVDLDLLRFFVKQRLRGFEVPSTPHFQSAEAEEWFIEMLRTSRRYLEYGTGGTTYVAAKLGVNFIAVDSDPYFLKSVRKKIRQHGFARSDGQTYHYADIGLTGFWGHPLRTSRMPARRLKLFRRYSDPPPECFFDGRVPDLVLVDGRFRVACALKALRMLWNERGWSIVVDDYVSRPQYAVIEDFAPVERYVGNRIAVFSRPRPTSLERLESAIRHYETIPH
jgi:hypothetical protein